jgi:hypothetical protein
MTLLMQFCAGRKIIIPHTAELAGFIGAAFEQSMSGASKQTGMSAVIYYHNQLIHLARDFEKQSEEEGEPEDIMNAIRAVLEIIDGHMVNFLKAHGIDVTDTNKEKEDLGNGETKVNG